LRGDYLEAQALGARGQTFLRDASKTSVLMNCGNAKVFGSSAHLGRYHLGDIVNDLSRHHAAAECGSEKILESSRSDKP